MATTKLSIDSLILIDDNGMPVAPTIRQLVDKDVRELYTRDKSKDKHNYLAKISIIEPTGSGGRNGISEVLKKGTVEKLTSENRVGQEMGAINRLLEQIGKNSSKIAYGPKETKNAINLGAVSELLVLDTKVADENMGDLMDMVENMKGEVMVISSEHEGGKQLESLGGMAAILRYEIA